jgi:hypothetical protein
VMLYRARMSLRQSLEERWFLKEERPTSGTGASLQRSQSRIAPEVKTLRRNVPRFGEAGQGLELEAKRRQLQIEPM